MEKNDFYQTLKNLGKNTILKLKWDRGNGSLEKSVIFTGFKDDSPFLYFDGGSLLSIDKIGGYKSIISLETL